MMKRGASRKAVGVRLLHAADNYLRKKQRRKGDLSRLIYEAIAAVDLAEVPLTLFHGKREKVTAKVTQVVMPQDMCDEIEKWAAARRCSMNELLNSALSAGLSMTRPSAVDGQTERKRPKEWSGLSSQSRKKFFDEILALNGGEAGPNPRSAAGSFYQFEPKLSGTVEVSSDGTRYLVGCLGSGDLVRMRDAGRAVISLSK